MDKEAGRGIQTVEKKITQKPVLAALDLDKKMRMEVNVLDYMMDGVLSMECENRRWRPVAYLSKSLNKTERNYKIHNKEILAVIRGLEN